MKIKLTINKYLLALTFTLRAQKYEYSTASISDSLKKMQNAIVRFEQIDVTISSQQDMAINTKGYYGSKRKVSAIDAMENYC
jgi:hypothetical protein